MNREWLQNNWSAIKAYMYGEPIQVLVLSRVSGYWIDNGDDPMSEQFRYRPTPKPVKKWISILENKNDGEYQVRCSTFSSKAEAEQAGRYHSIIEIEILE